MEDMRALEDGTVLVIILEHAFALNGGVLMGLGEWTPEERARISEFRDPAAKTSWCLSRWLLREALRGSAGIDAARRRLEYGEYGKPFLRGCDVKFNWSHSEGCVALALARGIEVGIDVERVDGAKPDYLAIARDQFSEAELEWMGTGPSSASWEPFLSLFVQKEAWLKAAGWGFGMPFASPPAALTLPPRSSPMRELLEVGGAARYFLAVDASFGASDAEIRFLVEKRAFPGREQSAAARGQLISSDRLPQPIHMH